jgi:F5/8 type C domain
MWRGIRAGMRWALVLVVVVLSVAFLPSTAWAADVTPTSCSADKILSADYACEKVYSDSDGYPWASTNNTGVLSFDFGTPRRLTSYLIEGRALSGGVTQAPKDWTVWASSDQLNWTQVDAVTGATSWSATEKRTYVVDTPTQLRYYEFRFTANNGDSLLAVDWMGFVEEAAPTTTTTTAPTTTSGTTSVTSSASSSSSSSSPSSPTSSATSSPTASSDYWSAGGGDAMVLCAGLVVFCMGVLLVSGPLGGGSGRG